MATAFGCKAGLAAKASPWNLSKQKPWLQAYIGAIQGLEGKTRIREDVPKRALEELLGGAP